MKRHGWCVLAALLPLLAFASSAQAGTASIAFPAVSVQGEGQTIILSYTLSAGETGPAVRVHAPDQPTGCPGATDAGLTIAQWAWTETLGLPPSGGAGWTPIEAGTYEFCVYFGDGTSVAIDRQVVPPLSLAIAVTPGTASTPSAVALTGVLADPLGQQMAIEMRYRAPGQVPCAATPASDPGAPIPDPQDAMYRNFWFLSDLRDSSGGFAVRAQTGKLDAGTYLLCTWVAPQNFEFPDLFLITFVRSTTFTVGSASDGPAPASPAGGASIPLALPRNVRAPTLTGKPRVGATLHCSKGIWDIPPSAPTYRWYRGASPIAHAFSAAYRVTKRDSGRRLRCKVVITSRDGRMTSKASAARGIARAAKKAPG